MIFGAFQRFLDVRIPTSASASVVFENAYLLAGTILTFC